MKNIIIICLLSLISFAGNLHAEDEVMFFDSPVDAETYLLRPGDELLVTFINSQIESLSLDIDPEGKIVHETIGLFNLQNKTLAFAKKELTKTLKQLYNVKEIEISITSVRQVTISVYGAVEKPGTYRGMTSDRVSDIIEQAGGITGNGSSRNILFLGGENQLEVDLDKAIFQGDVSLNPYLYAGRYIEVPSKSSKTVQVSGDVNFPREVELKEGDNLNQIIQLSGRFKNSATIDDVSIIRGNETVNSETVLSGDIVLVKSKAHNNSNSVKIFGAVLNQGVYQYTEGLSLENIISQAGGYASKANRELTTIFRKPNVNSHGEISHIRYPISLPIQSAQTSPFTLAENDSIFVPLQVGFVKISGAILNPGYFPYYPQKDILYYIHAAGGFISTANKDEIQIFNQISQSTIFVSSGVIVPDGAEIIVQVKEELK